MIDRENKTDRKNEITLPDFCLETEPIYTGFSVECKFCGCELYENEKYCEGCGRKVVWDD